MFSTSKPKLILFLLILFLGCSKTSDNQNYTIDCPAANRTGAICNDGTKSTATGTGACSTHGGVKYWICK
jgi:hypothetical protein